MKRRQRIEKLLLSEFKHYSIEVIDNSHLHIGHNDFNGNEETHIKIILKSNINIKINRLEIHKKINELLQNEFLEGLHSIEIKITK